MSTPTAALREWLANALALAVLGALALWLFCLHGGWPAWSPPGPARAVAAGLVVVAFLGGCAGAWSMRGRIARIEAGAGDTSARTDVLLVAHASQTGYAEQLARQTAESLRGAGLAVRVSPLAALDAAGLADTRRALFIASTTGEGDAPDAAAAFLHNLSAPGNLDGLRYGVLALGDREYRNFCAFGKRLDAWLRASGAEPWFDALEVDDGDPGALRHWQHQLGLLGGNPDLPDWNPPRYARWRLRERRLANPGSVGGMCFHVILEPADGGLPGWRAGDIAEIGPRHAASTVTQWLDFAGFDGDARIGTDGEPLWAQLAGSRLPDPAAVIGLSPQELAARLDPLAHREYSIASLPADGAIELLVRRMSRPDGSPGIGSGWLCEHAPIGADIALRIRANPGFHPPADDCPLILIGNGTGIAGLRVLLRQRIADGHRDNWLLFGERNAACDFHYGEEIARWQANGWLGRVDLAFSRDQAERIYVQQRVAESAPILRAHVEAGAAIYVCGSLEGMAPGVEAALRDALGADTLESLRVEGRYRRDVY
jgi:sulfite reductase (NADPH) flavoprotein alpha-component